MHTYENGQLPAGQNRHRLLGGAMFVLMGVGTATGEGSKATLEPDQEAVVEGHEYLSSPERAEVIGGYIGQLSGRIIESCEDDLPPICPVEINDGVRTISTTYFGLYTIEISGTNGPGGRITEASDFAIGLSAQQNHNIVEMPDGTPIEMSLSVDVEGTGPRTSLLARDDFNVGMDESNVQLVTVDGVDGIVISRANIQSGDAVDGEFVPWMEMTGWNVESVQNQDRQTYLNAQALLDGVYLQLAEETATSQPVTSPDTGTTTG